MEAAAAAAVAPSGAEPVQDPPHQVRIGGDVLRAFCERALIAAGAGKTQAEACADVWDLKSLDIVRIDALIAFRSCSPQPMSAVFTLTV
jgi:hypothetical protein